MTKTMKIQDRAYKKLNRLRGHNGCRTFNEVIEYLVNKHSQNGDSRELGGKQ